MIRLKEIQKALFGVVGWAQDYDPAKEIDKELCVSESGLYFQDAHPLLTLENIRSIMPEDWTFQYPDWNAQSYYLKGKKVKHDGKVFIANYDNTGIEPECTDFNSDFNNDFGSSLAGAWVVYPFESDYIRNITNGAINTAIQNFLTMKQINKETKDLLEKRMLFDGAARLENMLSPTEKIVGLEIVPVRALGVTTKIDRIGLQMRGGTGVVKLYLFHSSLVEPVKTFELNYTNEKGAFQWFDLKDCYLPYMGVNDAGGAWFLCYSQNALPMGMRALNVTRDWSSQPCETCMGYALESWKQITKYMQISPFCTDEPEGWNENPEMFDVGYLGYTNTINYGINLEVSDGCDLSDFIIKQKDIFANVIQKQVAVNVLRTIAMNPDVRVNRNQVNVTRDDLLYEIDGPVQGRQSGLAYDLKQAYKALEINTQGLDRICLTCNNGGVKYRTI